jgi:hypothetical protein
LPVEEGELKAKSPQNRVEFKAKLEMCSIGLYSTYAHSKIASTGRCLQPVPSMKEVTGTIEERP